MPSRQRPERLEAGVEGRPCSSTPRHEKIDVFRRADRAVKVWRPRRRGGAMRYLTCRRFNNRQTSRTRLSVPGVRLRTPPPLVLRQRIEAMSRARLEVDSGVNAGRPRKGRSGLNESGARADLVSGRSGGDSREVFLACHARIIAGPHGLDRVLAHLLVARDQTRGRARWPGRPASDRTGPDGTPAAWTSDVTAPSSNARDATPWRSRMTGT